MTALLEALGITSRNGVEVFIERLIAKLDDFDGDADFEDEPDLEDGADAEPEELEPNGDELDFMSNEDDCPTHLQGVPIVSL